MPNVKVSELPLATDLTGTERVLLNQGGVTKTASASSWLPVREATELTSISSGVQRQETTLTVPAGSVVLGAAIRVTVPPGGTTVLSMRSAGSDHQFSGDDIATTAGTTDAGTIGCPFVLPVTESFVYVFDAPTTDALGRIRCSIIYYAITPPSA